jgi:heterodisulfide reductase subunit C2
MIKVDSDFLESMKNAEDFNASACINCGSCTALCPINAEIMPRLLFRYVLLGAKDKVLENTDKIFTCLLCGMCQGNCPAGVNIAENMRSLRTYINDNVHGLARS